jgi:transcriptional regulator with XRE-family HTH domain
MERGMYFEELGPKIRQARTAKKLTQEELALASDLSRTTINQLESGACPDIGVKKLMSVFEVLGLEMDVTKKSKKRATDFFELACLSANVSYRGKLAKQELASALVTGKAPKDKRPQLRVVFDELPSSIFDGLVRQASTFCPAEKVSRNISAIAREIHSQKRSIA